MVFVKMRLKVASELLGVIEITRLELLEIANPLKLTRIGRLPGGGVVALKQSLYISS